MKGIGVSGRRRWRSRRRRKKEEEEEEDDEEEEDEEEEEDDGEETQGEGEREEDKKQQASKKTELIENLSNRTKFWLRFLNGCLLGKGMSVAVGANIQETTLNNCQTLDPKI